MRVLLDQCVPERLRHHLPGHDVFTARFKGWAGLKNGALLAAMAADGFQVLLTVDRGIQHQQNLAAAGVAVVLLTAPRNDVSYLLPLMPAAAAALATIQPGQVIEVTAP